MTQEDKKLLKDLSARLPYQVKVSVNGGKELWTLKGIFEGEHTGMMLILEPSFPSKDVSPQTSNWQLSQCKPYLRPLSSMTDEEKNEHFGRTMTIDIVQTSKEVIDYLNKKMFDYRGLIDEDLAIEVTKDNNPYND